VVAAEEVAVTSEEVAVAAQAVVAAVPVEAVVAAPVEVEKALAGTDGPW